MAFRTTISVLLVFRACSHTARDDLELLTFQIPPSPAIRAILIFFFLAK